MEQTQEEQQMQMLMTQLQNANLRQSVMQYINQTANTLDKNANSKALIETLARESVHNQKNTAVWKSRTKKSVVVGVVAVVLAITAQFLVNYFSNELSKEAHVDKQGAMVSTDGKIVKTQMEEMKVGADGALRSRKDDATVKTTPTLAKVALDSSLPDATLMALEEISVHSENGYTLQIKVHGFSRVPVLNSRCGNVVHFYTAWKGKVTLDSTDLLLDETTAAEFRGAGFSMATGGRRLAGEVSLDAFVRAVDDAKRSGKWTCANVPLPIISAQGSWQMTVYNPCGTKKNKEQNCYSEYGGLQLGVTALDDTLFATPETDQNLFWTTSSSQMRSARYGVILKEYPMHPGQQLVTITDFASDKFSIFQIESDQKRSHCSTGVEHEANPEKRPDSGDYDWHIEYTGITEVDGKILRGFNARLSAEAIVHLFGESRGNTAVAQFWDIAENLQPYAFSSVGSGGSMHHIANMFRSYKQDVTDGVVETAMKRLTGKNVAELLSCTENEKNKNVRPTMRLQDLTSSEAGYYVHSSVQKSGAVSKYLEDATNDEAMSDFCYETCKNSVDAFRSRLPGGLPGDVCPVVRTVVDCLQREMSCQSSKFISNHGNECHADGTAKNFSDSGESGRLLEADTLGAESGEPVQLFVNETGLAQTAMTSRKLVFFEWDCHRDGEKHPGLVFDQVFEEKGTIGDCNSNSLGKACWCLKYSVKTTNWDFSFTIKWGLIGARLGLVLIATACAPLAITFPAKLEPALSATQCYIGAFEITAGDVCPAIPGISINGSLSANFEVKLFPDSIFETTLVGISLCISAGMIDYVSPLERGCWWQQEQDGDQPERRRRMRRRYNRVCPDQGQCDIYIKGELSMTLLSLAKAAIEALYYIFAEVLEIKMSIQYRWLTWTGFYWETLCDKMLYRREYSDYAPPGSNEQPVVHGCEWTEHWGYRSAGVVVGRTTTWTENLLSAAKSHAMRECKKQTANCAAVQCWSTKQKVQSGNFQWTCQMRRDAELIQVEDTTNPWRDQVFTHQNCGLVTVPPPPVPQYQGPDFIGDAVWGLHWGKTVDGVVSGPDRHKLFLRSTLLMAKRDSMEYCKYYNTVTTGKLCKAVVCWSTKTVQEEEDASMTDWECQMRSSNRYFAASTTDFRVQTYTPDACKRCDNARWGKYWGSDVREEEGREVKVTGSSESEEIFRDTGNGGINRASNMAKVACGNHNSVTTGNLCKAVVCWSTKTEFEVPDPHAATWACQMRSSNVRLPAIVTAGKDYRVRTYLPEGCS